jgi:hypothetical protein
MPATTKTTPTATQSHKDSWIANTNTTAPVKMKMADTAFQGRSITPQNKTLPLSTYPPMNGSARPGGNQTDARKGWAAVTARHPQGEDIEAQIMRMQGRGLRRNKKERGTEEVCFVFLPTLNRSRFVFLLLTK